MPSDRLPLVELFGPTIQGEGPDAGRPTHFVRLGGCDYRCSWCDTQHAVDPAKVREAERVSTGELARRLHDLGVPYRVVLTGGNPALHHLGPLVALLHRVGYYVAVETQGSVWRPWLAEADRLVVSPKPPSAGVVNRGTDRFMDTAERLVGRGRAALKIVVFDETDFAWALKFREHRHDWPLYLSAGTPVGEDDEATRRAVAERFAWLAERAAGCPELHGAVVLPQLHVVAWGTKVGV